MTSTCPIIVFASGTEKEGGSGFENLVYQSRSNELGAVVVAVVSNWPNGGVYKRAMKLGIPFEYFERPYSLSKYRSYLLKYKAEWIILCGWLKLVPMANSKVGKDGLDPKKTLNIHPGPLPQFGGKGMYGLKVHKKVIEMFKENQIITTGVTIHYVTDTYDDGPIIHFEPVPIENSDTPESLASRVSQVEHQIYPKIINLAVNGLIYWDGTNPESLFISKPSDDIEREHPMLKFEKN